MRTVLVIENPDKIEVTIRVTASLGEWKEIRKHLPNHPPASKLKDSIDDVVSRAEQVFIAQTIDQ